LTVFLCLYFHEFDFLLCQIVVNILEKLARRSAEGYEAAMLGLWSSVLQATNTVLGAPAFEQQVVLIARCTEACYPSSLFSSCIIALFFELYCVHTVKLANLFCWMVPGFTNMYAREFEIISSSCTRRLEKSVRPVL
jgi:hypothetical protein